ncbi:MAG: Hsp20/alpha crystallin family protein [Pyrinomonadaceae bacterium]
MARGNPPSGSLRAQNRRRPSVRPAKVQLGFKLISLPTFVDASKIDAEFKHGVLTVTLPKFEEARPKHISVKVH